jgi:hypothetical protein
MNRILVRAAHVLHEAVQAAYDLLHESLAACKVGMGMPMAEYAMGLHLSC